MIRFVTKYNDGLNDVRLDLVQITFGANLIIILLFYLVLYFSCAFEKCLYMQKPNLGLFQDYIMYSLIITVVFGSFLYDMVKITLKHFQLNLRGILLIGIQTIKCRLI